MTWELVDYWYMSGGCCVVRPDSADIVITGGQAPSGMTEMPFTVSISTDRGDSWTRTLLSGTTEGICLAMAFAPSDPLVLWAAGTAGGAGAVYRSTDGGHTWVETAASPEVVYGIAVHPGDPNTAYAAADGLYRTTDAGANWDRLATGLGKLRDIRFQPGGGRLVAGGDEGVVASTDGGENWTDISVGLETPHVSRLLFAGPDHLLAGTSGRACAEWDPLSTVAEPDGGRGPVFPGLRVRGSPGRGAVLLDWPGHGPRCAARLIDVAGRIAWRGGVTFGPAGATLALPALPAGAYRLQLDDGRQRSSSTIVRF